MLDRLPNDIVLSICETAAVAWTYEDRNAVVDLALTCKASYNCIAPILYRTLRILRKSARIVLESFAHESPELAQRVFRHVRVLLVASGIIDLLTLDVEFFPNVEVIQGNMSAIELFLPSCPALRDVQIYAPSYRATLETLEDSVRSRFTHYCAFALDDRDDEGSEYGDYLRDPAEWTRSILDLLPSATHLGFEFWADQSQNETVDSFDLRIFDHVIRTAVADPRIACVAVRIGGLFATRFEEFRLLAYKVANPKLRLQEDDSRPQWFEDQWRVFHKVATGTTLWTEAQPVDEQGDAYIKDIEAVVTTVGATHI